MTLSPARWWEALLARPVPTGVNAALAWTGLGLSVAAAAVVPLPLPPLAKFLVVLAFASFGPGSALLSHVRLGNAVASWAMALVLSLSLFGIGAAVMVWSANWHPYPVLLGYAFGCVLASVAAFAPTLAGRGGLPDGPRAGPPVLPRQPARLDAPDAKVPLGPDATSVLPRIPPAGPDATSVLPRIPAGVGPPGREAREAVPFQPPAGRMADFTRWIPRIREPLNDSTAPVRETEAPQHVPGVLRIVSVVFGPAFLASTVLYWVAALRMSDATRVNDYGLLSVMHPYFFVAIALCVFGFVVEVSRGARRTWLLAGHLVVLLLILHATVPLLVYEPEYAWTYKHVGVIELFKAKGGILNIVDIYQAWPTFFATVAQLGALSGLDSLRIAAWAPVYFDAANCLPLFAIVRSLTDDRRLPWLTVFMFSSLNWVAQDYLSPQAFTYVLCLGAALIMLRWLRRVPGPAGVWPRWLGRLWRWLHTGLAEVPYVSRRTERVALASLYLVFLVVVIAHQLSPYLVALSATGLVVLGLVRSWRIVPILFGICVVYLLPHYDVVDNYGLFDGFNIFSTFAKSTQGVAPDAIGSAGRVFSVQVVQILSVLMWGLSALAVLISRERLGPVAAPATLAFAPFAVMFGQGYGGEAIYRVFLFSVPWCSYLIATLFLRIPKVPRPVAVLGATVALSAAALASIQGAHGQLVFDQFSKGEVEATRYLYQHAPPDSAILAPSSNIPLRLTANYGQLGGGGDPDDLSVVLPHNRNTITEADMTAVDNFASAYGGTPVFLMISRSEVAYLHYFGYGPDGQLDNLNRALATSTAWKVFYRAPDTVIYQYVGNG
jgi:hypothetical protein